MICERVEKKRGIFKNDCNANAILTIIPSIVSL